MFDTFYVVPCRDDDAKARTGIRANGVIPSLRETSNVSSEKNAARIGHRGQFQYLQKLWRRKFHTIYR